MSDWSEAELAAAVDAYRWMERQISEGRKLNKAQVYRGLSETYGRRTGSWEYRMQNISHVLDQAGLPWLTGLKPASHAGSGVEKKLSTLLGLPFDNHTLTSGETREILERNSLVSEAQYIQHTAISADERERVLATIVRRRGQPAFREALLKLYGGRCVISGCDVTDALEAAHICPYRGGHSDSIDNGLLLRADIHTLFDLYLVSIDPNSVTTVVCPALMESMYGSLHGSPVLNQSLLKHDFNISSVAWHRAQCEW
ncbi:TPA: HNH endonuclease [Stenotrophomonas maltophilia]|nr:HNH endonuclease [Stenotrophomonas maltophilia]HDS1042201.1 HNH endonuclease [Stenotrophomonas maltophilia]